MSASPPDIDYDALVGLFTPGSGVMPPLLAGREPALATLGKFKSKLAGNQPPPRDVVLYGPRGNGKTVLLIRFLQDCRQAGADTVRLTPDDIPCLGKLARLLLQRTPPMLDNESGSDAADPGNSPEGGAQDVIAGALRKATGAKGQAAIQSLQALQENVQGAAATMLASQARIGAPGLASVIWEKMSPDELDEALKPLLAERCAGRPLVVAVDEAHTLDKAVGKRLLNLSQSLRGDGIPFLLAMAGTPNLETHLNNMDSTFWDRSELIGIGRLSPNAARLSLAEPLAGFPPPVGFDEDALTTVVAESQRYPYFIQLWGEALCEALQQRQATHIDAGIVADARPVFEKRRVFYYEKRYQEMRQQALLPAAKAMATLFLDGAPTWRAADLEQQLTELAGLKPKKAARAVTQLAQLGYIWQDYGANVLEPGIPSLMAYVLADGKTLGLTDKQAGERAARQVGAPSRKQGGQRGQAGKPDNRRGRAGP